MTYIQRERERKRESGFVIILILFIVGNNLQKKQQPKNYFNTKCIKICYKQTKYEIEKLRKIKTTTTTTTTTEVNHYFLNINASSLIIVSTILFCRGINDAISNESTSERIKVGPNTIPRLLAYILLI